MYYASHFLSASRADSIFHLDNDTLKAHWDAFAPVYYGTDSKEELEEKVQELRPFIAAKMLFVVSKLKGENRSFSEPLLQIFDKYIPK